MKKIALLLLSIILAAMIVETAQAGCFSIFGRQRRLERRAARQDARQEARANGYFSLGIWR